ncbi:MAG: zinc metallopeptidase [Clostridia bacterium]|nr:zinc metallopeptidase [Clostridia bacterium]
MLTYYGIDWTYVILVLPAVFFALWAQYHVQSTFKKASSVPVSSGMTGAEAARMILDRNGLYAVRIERVSGELTDHFDPRSGVLRLSESVYGASTAAAVGVACHEAGHAVQHEENYRPIRIRSAVIPLTRIGSTLAIPLLLIGLLLNFSALAYIGILLFAFSAVFQLLTLPVEFDASARALKEMADCGRFSEEELTFSRKVLRAAALTYVAALAVSLMQILRLLLITDRRGRR